MTNKTNCVECDKMIITKNMKRHKETRVHKLNAKLNEKISKMEKTKKKKESK